MGEDKEKKTDRFSIMVYGFIIIMIFGFLPAMFILNRTKTEFNTIIQIHDEIVVFNNERHASEREIYYYNCIDTSGTLYKIKANNFGSNTLTGDKFAVRICKLVDKNTMPPKISFRVIKIYKKF